MALQIRIAPRREFASKDLCEMHTLRARAFKQRLGWDVAVLSGMEIDGYDALEPLYMMIRETTETALRGCWRLLPTEGPYMLKDSFAQLLHGQEAPRDARIWELSRFAIRTEGAPHYGFADITLASIGEIIRHARRSDIDGYVTVTTTAIERLLRRCGVVTRRLGAPLVIGARQAVALHVDVEASLARLFGTARGAAEAPRADASGPHLQVF
jgi:acyl homoserine lactone synthase